VRGAPERVTPVGSSHESAEFPTGANKVVAMCVTAHGATVRTGSVSRITAVEGVRIVD
jgi:hypothetical protein